MAKKKRSLKIADTSSRGRIEEIWCKLQLHTVRELQNYKDPVLRVCARLEIQNYKHPVNIVA